MIQVPAVLAIPKVVHRKKKQGKMGSKAALYDPRPLQPNVQEMVRTDPFQVPERYIRDEKDMAANDADLCSQLSSEVPTIDVSLLSDGNKEELRKLDQACKEWGFFQIVNHGVATELTKDLEDSAEKFFQLPLEEKNKIAMSPNGTQGYGRPFVDQILDWGDKLLLVVYPHQCRMLDVWPPSPFKETIEAYSSELKRLGEELLRSISLIMGMEKDELLNLHQDLVQPISVAYYPPCFMPDKVLGHGSHSDRNSLSILMQGRDVQALQIKHKGKWVPITPLPNAFVVNVGDTIEIWSNGKYKSIEHRVVTNKSKARMSYSTFFSPNQNAELEPLDPMVLQSPGSLPLYKKITYGDYLKQTRKIRKEDKEHVTEVAKNIAS